MLYRLSYLPEAERRVNFRGRSVLCNIEREFCQGMQPASKLALGADHVGPCQHVVQPAFLPGEGNHQKADAEQQQRKNPTKRAKTCSAIGHLLIVHANDLQAEQPFPRGLPTGSHKKREVQKAGYYDDDST